MDEVSSGENPDSIPDMNSLLSSIGTVTSANAFRQGVGDGGEDYPQAWDSDRADDLSMGTSEIDAFNGGGAGRPADSDALAAIALASGSLYAPSSILSTPGDELDASDYIPGEFLEWSSVDSRDEKVLYSFEQNLNDDEDAPQNKGLLDAYGYGLDGDSVQKLTFLETEVGAPPVSHSKNGNARSQGGNLGQNSDVDDFTVCNNLEDILSRVATRRGKRGQQGAKSVTSTPHSSGDAVGLPFKPVDRVLEEQTADYNALLAAVKDLPLASASQQKCKRCGSPTPDRELELNQGNICSSCYTAIHSAINSAAALGEQDPARRFSSADTEREAADLEKKTTAAALLVTKNFISKRKPPGGALQDRNGQQGNTNPRSSSAESHARGWKEGNSSMGSQNLHGAGAGSGSRNGSSGGGRGARAGTVSGGDGWNVKASDRSTRTVNPIRQLVQGIAGDPNPEKELIDLSVGDPTRYGNLKVDDEVVEKLCEVVRDGKHNGYTQSMGNLEPRRAVASRYSLPSCAPLNEDDVVLTSGVSGALELALGALANEGDNVLLPRPGFPLFKTMLDGFGVKSKYYSVLPNRSWEVDIEDLLSQADDRTVAIVVNNPSNPCGSVYSARHIQEIVDAASTLRLPIVADEVYADMVFSGRQFVSIASMSSDVPVLSVGGLSKQFVVPGWRTGWLLVHDRNNVLEDGGVRLGIRRLTTRMLMPNAPVQGVLPYMLAAGRESSAFRSLMSDLETNAEVTIEGLADCVGLRTVSPQGAMYLMVEVDVKRLGFDDDLDFTKTLRAEESVFVLPGQCFQAPNFVRIVFCAPPSKMREATGRIKQFCKRHVSAKVAQRQQ